MIELEVNTTDALDGLVSLQAAMSTGLFDVLYSGAQYLEGVIKGKVFETFKASTGTLARSFRASAVLQTSKDTLSTGAFSDLVYAQVQEEGATITSKRPNGWLAIPVSDYVKKKAGFWPRDWPDRALLCIKSKKGNLVLVEREALKKKKWIIHYVLKRSVDIKGKGYLEASRREAGPVIERKIIDHLSEAW